MRAVNRQLRADPSVKNYVWSWEPLPLVRTARACTAQKVISRTAVLSRFIFFWKRKEFERAREPVRHPFSLSFCRTRTGWQWWKIRLLSPKVFVVSDRRCGTFSKKINKNGKIKAFCTLCEKTLPYNGATTSNLREHLEWHKKIRTVAHCCDPVTRFHFSDIKKSYLVISLGLCGGYWWYINLSFVWFIYTTGKRIFKEPSRIFAFKKRTFVNANSTFVWALPCIHSPVHKSTGLYTDMNTALYNRWILAFDIFSWLWLKLANSLLSSYISASLLIVLAFICHVFLVPVWSFLYKQCTSSLPLFQRNTNKQTIICWNSTIACLLVLRWKRGRELVHCLYKKLQTCLPTSHRPPKPFLFLFFFLRTSRN